MADEIIVKYVADVKQLEKALDGITKRIDGIEGKSKASAKGAESSFGKMSTGITSSLKGIGAAIGVAFGTQQIIAFGKEAVQLAAKAEGIGKAFSKLNSPQLLDQLRKATRGTVDDLKLMQGAVQANNFKLPLEQLAKLFKFATDRAIETGESVEYLTQSIILGISRKSIPIMDNLGISSVELQEEMKKTGDFASAAFNIVDRSMLATGDVADTTATKIARLTTDFENFKVEAGKEIIGQLSDFNDQLSETGKSLGDTDFDASAAGMFLLGNAIEALLSPFTTLAWIVQKNADAFNWIKDTITGTDEVIPKATKNVNGLATAYAALSKNAEELFKSILKEASIRPEQIENLAYLNAEIQKLKDKQLDANTPVSAYAALNAKIAKLEEQRTVLLGGMTEAMKAAQKAQEDLNASFEKAAVVDRDDEFEMTPVNTEVIDGMSELERLWINLFKGSNLSERMRAELEEGIDLSLNELDRFSEEWALMQEQQAEDNRAYFNGIISAWQDVTSIAQQLTQAQYDNQQAQLEAQLQSGAISQEQYDQRRRNLARKQAKQQKEFAIGQAIINTALGVTNAIATAPNIIIGLILAAVAAGVGAAEIAVISSQPVPSFAKGVIDLNGKGTATSDSIDAKLSKGESVMTAKETQIHKELFKSIRNNRYDDFIMDNHVAPVLKTIMDGGLGALGASYKLNSAFNDRNMLKATDRLRGSNRDDARYIVSELSKVMITKRDRYV